MQPTLGRTLRAIFSVKTSKVPKCQYSTTTKLSGPSMLMPAQNLASSSSKSIKQAIISTYKIQYNKHQSTKVRSFHTSSQCMANEWDGVPNQILGMPALSPSMTTGEIAQWLKKEGDKISAGDVIAEIVTDKATVAFEATEDGYLAKILRPGGSKDVAISDPIAVVVPKKEHVTKFANYKAGGSSSKPAQSSSASSTPAAPKSAPTSSKSSGSPKPSVPHTVLSMPSLSPTMETGVIASWKKQEGDKISAGDVLAEIETDKATVAFEATEDGFLGKILLKAQTGSISVNTPIAIVVNKKADIDAVKDYTPAGQSSAPPSPTTAAPSSSKPSETSASSTTTSSSASEGGRIIASPYAKLVAKEMQIPLGDVRGTGPHGRIIAHDVLNFTPTAAPSKSTTQKQSAAAAPSGMDYEDLSVSNIRRVTAERLTHSKQSIPHYYLTTECVIDDLIKVRAELNSAAAQGEYKLSVNDFVIKASALALRKVPEVNSEWRGDAIRRYHNVDINVAVSTEHGLLTPIVRDADLKGLAQISDGVKAASQKAKDNKLNLQDLATGTFTVSNLGMFGISQFAAVINPPQAAILAIGTSEARVVPNSGADKATNPFIVKNILTVTLSCDHRVVDGAVGARWLQAFKDLMENPYKLLL